MPETPDFTKMSQQIYDQWEQGMTAWWDQVLESPAFLSALGDTVANQSRARGQYAKAVDENLKRMHLPTRGDLVRVARIATLLEEKVLTVEDHLLSIQDTLGRIEKEAITARIDAAETRIELRERLNALEERLEALEGKKPTRSRKSRASKAADTEEA
jgi:hypothetical protein